MAAKQITIRALCYYLRRYLEREGEPAKKRLLKIYRTQMGGDLSRATLWRHLKLKSDPDFAAGLVYMTFLRQEGAIMPNGKKRLFMYVYPELLREKKAGSPEAKK